MKKVIIKFMFKGTFHSLDIIMPETEAKAILRDWINQNYSASFHGYDRDQDKHWAVNGSEVASIFTMDFDDFQKRQRDALEQSQRGQPSSSPWGASFQTKGMSN